MKGKQERKKRAAAITALLVLALALSGCGVFHKEEAAQEGGKVDERLRIQESGELTVVGFSQIGSESVWRTANTRSVERALSRENGYFLLSDNARQRQENQIKAIRSYISQRVDYIVFSPIMEEGWDTVLEEAKQAGIPVILMDRMADVDESLYTTWVGTDMTKEGENAARWLEDYLKRKGREEESVNIVILQGTPGSSSELGRTKGFEDVAAAHPNWNILDKRTGDFTTAKGKEVMQQFLRRYQDIDVVVSQNDDMTFGAIEAIEEAGMRTGAGGDIIMISFDAVKNALEMVQSGKIDVDIECNPEQGAYIDDVIGKLERGEKVEKAYVVEEKVFTRENVGEYLDSRSY